MYSVRFRSRLYASSSVVWFGHLPSYLVVLAGSSLVGLVLICPGQGILVGISVLMVSKLDHWNPVKAPTLYHYFYHTFSPHGLYPGLGMVVVNDGMLLSVMCLMIVVTLLKGSG